MNCIYYCIDRDCFGLSYDVPLEEGELNNQKYKIYKDKLD